MAEEDLEDDDNGYQAMEQYSGGGRGISREPGGASLIDVLDRVLDKGIVIDAWVRISVIGLELITIEARVVVASVDTYLRYAMAIAQMPAASRPAIAGGQGEGGRDRRQDSSGLLGGLTNQLGSAVDSLFDDGGSRGSKKRAAKKARR